MLAEEWSFVSCSVFYYVFFIFFLRVFYLIIWSSWFVFLVRDLFMLLFWGVLGLLVVVLFVV